MFERNAKSITAVLIGMVMLIIADNSYAGEWLLTSSMNVGRIYHSTTLLQDGKVLVAGGYKYYNGFYYYSSCEIYGSSNGSWAPTDSMNSTRANHTATLLQDGKVLVAGGYKYGFMDNIYLSSCEIYDPQVGNWTSVGSLSEERAYHTATLLQDGKVLVTGGYKSEYDDMEGILSYTYSSCDIYDPSNGTWTPTDSMNSARFGHTATLLQDGKVLITGGGDHHLSCEIYDPQTGYWIPADSMNSARSYFTATLLQDGKVLVTGGKMDNIYLSSCEIYDPQAGNWTSAGSLSEERAYHTATLLQGGKVLVTGGYKHDGSEHYYSSCEVYDPSNSTWAPSNSMNHERTRHTAILLQNGKVLVAGGIRYSHYYSSCEIYSSLRIFSPNGGENMAGSSTHTILWQYDNPDLADHYRLLYSIDGGSSYPDTVAANISIIDSTHDWIIPEITSDYVRIKIQVIGPQNRVLIENYSNGDFKIDASPPAAVTDLHVTDRTYNTITLKWSAPGDDSLSGGRATEYDIRYSISPITEANWGATIQCDDEPTPSWPGGNQTFTIMNLLTDTPYYFAMKTRDEHYHWSGLSNVFSDTTELYPVIPSSQYPMFRYNIQHTGRSPYYGALSNNIKWYYATDQVVSSSPVVGPDGIIYFTSGNNNLYAINPDGTKKWDKSILATKSSPAIAIDSTIYIGTYDGTLKAFRSNGDIKWEYSVTGSISSSPAIGEDGAVYFGSTNDTLYSVNADGSLKWKHATGGDIMSSPAISPDGIVYVGSNDHKLYAINPDGSLSWSMNTPEAIISSPAVDTSSGVIYAGSCNGKLYAINPNGTIGWTYTTGDQITSSPAIDAKGNVLFGSFDGKVYSLSSNGDLLWAYQTEGIIESSPAIDARGSIYIGSNDGTIYCLNGSDGSLVWSGITGDKVTSSPAIAANSCIYVGSNDGRLYAYGPMAPVTLISPNGGETWDKNTIHNILWATTGSIEYIELYYSLDSGNSYTLISDSEIDDGIYPWTLPDTVCSICKVKVVAYDTGGNSDWDASDADFSIGKEVNVDESVSSIPSVYSLAQNYPNPFNPNTTISYSLPDQSPVNLTVFDISGQEVTTLQDTEKPPGNYEVQWNGLDHRGNQVSTGVYFARLNAGSYSETIKMVYLK